MTKTEIANLAAALGFEGVDVSHTKAEMIAAFIAAQGGRVNGEYQTTGRV